MTKCYRTKLTHDRCDLKHANQQISNRRSKNKNKTKQRKLLPTTTTTTPHIHTKCLWNSLTIEFGQLLAGFICSLVWPYHIPVFIVRIQSLYLQVVYYEHAHHQHVYDDHDEGGWGLGSSHSGNYWKRRSLNEKGEPIEVTYSASPDSIPSSGPPPGAAVASASYETYRPYESAPNIYGSVVPSASGYTDPQSIVYSKSRPDSYSGFL